MGFTCAMLNFAENAAFNEAYKNIRNLDIFGGGKMIFV